MIAFIKGILEVKTTGYIIVETGGIGYKIFMADSAIEQLGEIGQEVKVHTYLKVREDDVSLYGFKTNEELRMFELLISVSGVGAKSAIAILSNITPSSFALGVISNDIGKLKKLPGVGPKTAQRIVLELKDKLKTSQSIEAEMEEQIESCIAKEENVREAISALQVLGYSRKEIDEAMNKIDKNSLAVEDLIRQALNRLARQ